MRGINNLEKFMLKAEGFVKKNAPTILTCAGAVGVVATSIFASKAGTKAARLLDEAEAEKKEKLTKMEKLDILAVPYIPTVLSGLATVACIFGANHLNQKKQAALIAAYGVLDQSFKAYRTKMLEIYGNEQDEEIREAIARDNYKDISEKTSDEELMFYDEYSNQYFWKTMTEVKDAEYHFNRNLALRGYAELNEFYEFLGLEPTPYGATVGWSLDVGAETYGYSWVDFYHEMHESGDPDVGYYYMIVMPFGPTADFMEW